MTSSRKETRARYTEVWFLYNLYSITMPPKSKDPSTSHSNEFEEEQQAVDDYIEQSGLSVPPVSELLSRVAKLETTKLPDDQLTDNDQEHDHEELAVLMELEQAESSKTPTIEKGKKPVAHVSDNDVLDDDDYEESYASQQETAQLREDFDNITEKFNTLETQFNLIMKERQNLPDVINNIRSDLNTQLTQFSDKLYTILESQASKKDIQTALATIEEVRSEHSDQLKAASGYLSSEPKASSPIVNRGISLKGKGKFKPVK